MKEMETPESVQGRSREAGGGWWVKEVGSRAVVEVRGRDAARFLQGLTTNNLLDLLPAVSPDNASSNDQGGRYTAFLTPAGRFLADALVSLLPSSHQQQRQGEQSFLVECDARAAGGLVLHLRRYRLRAHVDIVAPPSQQNGQEWTVGAFLMRVRPVTRIGSPDGGGHGAMPSASCPRAHLVGHLRSLAPSLPCFVDPRAEAMGVRVYYRPGTFAPPPGFVEASAKDYRLHRILHAVPEGIDELEPNVALPLECNLDALHGVSYDKGCYLGQELTSRVHHTGVIRKRLMPVICFSPEDEVKERNLRVVERLVHGAADDSLLPSVLRELPSLATTNVAVSPKTELYVADGSPERRSVGRLCGSVADGLGFALLRLHHATATLTPSFTDSRPPFLAKALWPPPYPLPAQ